jgi:hypothetical protein
MHKWLLAGLIAPGAASAQVFPNDPILNLTFDDTFGIGQLVTDESGNRFDAWSTTDPEHVSFQGLNGDGMAFDGKSDEVVLPQDAINALATLGAGSVFVRFSYEDLIDKQGALPLFYMGIDDTAQVDTMFIIEVGHGEGVANHRLYFTWFIAGTLTLCFDTGFDLNPGQVYSFLGIVSEQGNTGWLDGKELTARHYNAGDKTTSAFFDDLPHKSVRQFTIGQGKAADGITPDFVNFRGVVDEVQVFGRPLTPIEARAITSPVK